MADIDLTGWLPIRMYWMNGRLCADWCWFGKTRLTAPFFHDSVQDQFREPFNVLFRPQTTIDVLGERYAAATGVPPAGFIFHLSRCGSTLLSQMLATLPDAVVLSEPMPVDTVLRSELPDDLKVEWLRWTVAAMAQPRNGETRLFVKFDSWHIRYLHVIERAFPGVPWIFLYRDPIEVMASHLNHRGAQMIPFALDPTIFGFAPEEIAGMPLDDYGARVLARICEAATDAFPSPLGRLVEYRELPEAMFGTLDAHFHLGLTDADRQRMRDVASRHAKNPVLPFANDAEEKRRAIGESARIAVERYVVSTYHRLEELHRHQTDGIIRQQSELLN